MEIYFQDPNETPLPPQEVRIRQLDADPYPDGRRVRVYLEITAFQRRPDAEINVTNAAGAQVASVHIVETIDPRMEVTIHLREPKPAGQYTVSGTVYYRDIDLSGEPGQAGDPVDAGSEPETIIVDTAQTSFDVP